MAAQTIAELLISIGVDVDGAKEAEKKIGKVTKAAENTDKKGGAKLKKFAKGAGVAFAAVGAAALAAAGAIFKLVDSVTSAGDEIAKSARRAGLGVEEFQKLSFAAKRSGASTESLAKAARNFTKFFNEAEEKGSTPFSKSLESVGLSMGQLAGLSFEDRLGAISDALLTVEDKSKRTALAQRILGEEAGPQLASLLELGSAGLRDMTNQAVELGAVLSGQAVKKSEEFQDELTNMKATLTGVANTIGIELVPLVQDVIKEIKDWTLKNRALIVVRVKEFIAKLIPVLKDLVDLVKIAVSVFSTFVEMAGGVKGATVSMAAGFVAMKLAAAGALGPVGLIVLAFTALLPLALKLGDRLGDVAFEMTKVGRAASALDAAAGGRTGKRGAAFIKLANEADRRERSRLLRIRAKAISDLRANPDNDIIRDLAINTINTVNRSLSNIQERGEAAEIAAQRQSAAVKGATEDSRSFEEKFAQRREDAALVRAQLGGGKRADKLVEQVGLGTLTADQALSRRKGGGGGGKGKKEGAAPLRQLTEIEAFAKSRGFENLPVQQARIKDEDIKPQAVINITNNNFDIDMDISGVSDPIQAGREAGKAVKEEFDKRLARAAQSGQVNVAR